MQPEFIAHNIRLDDGRATMPKQAFMLAETSMVSATRRILNLAFPAGLHGRSIVDVGCLEGGHAVEFARAGMKSLGLEVRDSNLACCEFVQRNLSLPNLAFVQDDAMNIARHGPFDAIFACGLLYHLDFPRVFLEQASSVCSRIILLHTHIAKPHETPSRVNHKLSDMTWHDGMSGRWYGEYEEATPDQLNKMKETSWSNKKSFWPTKQDLLNTLRSVGFDTLFEDFDCMGNLGVEMTDGYYANQDRVFIIGLKSQGAAPIGDELDIMRRSTSWRLTAPLRALRRII